MKYKMLVTDIDGTLLNDRTQLTAKNIEAIYAARDKGAIIVLCSGRSLHSIRQFEDALGLNKKGDYGIGFNGAVIYETDTRKIMHRTLLDGTSARAIIAQLKEMHANIVVYSGDKLYAEKEVPHITNYINRIKLPLTLTDDLTSIPGDPYKVIVKDDNHNLKRIAEKMTGVLQAGTDEKLADSVGMFFTSSDLLEFTNPTIDKGKAALYLADFLGVKRELLVAVGDNFNDLPMIKAAGLGITVASAEKDIRDAAGAVTKSTNNEDAIAEVIYKYFV